MDTFQNWLNLYLPILWCYYCSIYLWLIIVKLAAWNPYTLKLNSRCITGWNFRQNKLSSVKKKRDFMFILFPELVELWILNMLFFWKCILLLFIFSIILIKLFLINFMHDPTSLMIMRITLPPCLSSRLYHIRPYYAGLLL